MVGFRAGSLGGKWGECSPKVPLQLKERGGACRAQRCTAVIWAVRMWRQEDHELKSNFGCAVRLRAA